MNTAISRPDALLAGWLLASTAATTLIISLATIADLILRRARAAARAALWTASLTGILAFPVLIFFRAMGWIPIRTTAERWLTVPMTALSIPAQESIGYQIVGGLWLAGVLWMLHRILLGRRKEQAILRAAQPLQLTGQQAALVPCQVRVVRSPRCRSPFAMEAWHPVIVLPDDVTSWPGPTLEMVLRHEVAHLLRGDPRVLRLASLALALQWFYPAVWVAARRLRFTIECACDDAVLAAGAEDRASYAQSLVDLARSGQLMLHAGPRFSTAPLAGRVTAILDEHRARQPISRPAELAFRLTFVAIAGLLASRVAITPQRLIAPHPQSALRLTTERDRAERVRDRATRAASRERMDRLLRQPP